MAVKFAVANGSWSNPAIWDNGVLPAFDDFVYSNGFTVDIDQNITIGSLQNGASPVRIPDIATPVMTTDSSPSGIASASSINGSNVAYLAFDQSPTSTWLSANGAATGWLRYQFPTAKVIRRYSMISVGAANNNPRNWTFEGSNDGGTWTVLHTVALGSGIAQNAWYDSGSIGNTTAYLYYRINVSLVGASPFYISELQMSESTSSNLGGSAGGGFTISTNRTITCTNITGLLNANATTLLTVTSNPTITINANIRTGIGNVIRVNGTNYNITINGDVTASNTTASAHAINRQAAGTMTIVGNIFGGVAASYGILMNDTGTLNVTGNVYGSAANATGNSAAGIAITQNGTINITGSVIGNLANSGSNQGILSSVGATINIIGNVQGSSLATSNFGLNLTGASIVNITGNVIAGTGSSNTNYAINSGAAVTLTINGSVVATTACNAISLTSLTSTVTINGIIQNANNKMAFYGPNLYIGNAVTQWKFNKPDNSDRTLYSADTFAGVPLASNVRQGTTYGPGSSLTGTLNVPPASSVAVGVPVDNTTGTAMISVTDMGALLASYNV